MFPRQVFRDPNVPDAPVSTRFPAVAKTTTWHPYTFRAKGLKERKPNDTKSWIHYLLQD